MPDEPQEELHPAVAEDEVEAKETPEVETAEPTTVDKVIEAYRDINRESVDVARQAMGIAGLDENTKRALQAFRPPNAFLEMMENQARISKMLSAFTTPVPSGLTSFIANMNQVNGMAKMLEDTLLPSRQLRELMSQFVTPVPKLIGLDSSLLESFRRLTVANSLDTSVARMLAGFTAQQSAIDAILKGWRSPVWEDIKKSSLMLEQLQASTVASGILEIGSLERFNSVRLLQATSLPQVEEDAEATAQVVELVRVEILDTVELALESVDPRLVKTWRGAKQALKSDNPDRSRHLAVSLRGMTENLMWTLAPDSEVKVWSTSPNDYQNGRPTRSARIRYIYSRYGAEVQAFFDLDVKTAIYWIDLINKETHTLDGFETDEAMEALLARFEGIALALIRGAKGFQ